MSGDLEDFLRRAAQRRQAKATQAAQSTPRPRPKPQYSDSRTERVVRTVTDEAHDEVLTASVVSEADPNSIEGRRARLKKARADAARAEAEAAERLKKVRQSSRSGRSTAVAMSGDLNRDLLALLQHPSGLRKAFLLREILDRPTHRW